MASKGSSTERNPHAGGQNIAKRYESDKERWNEWNDIEKPIYDIRLSKAPAHVAFGYLGGRRDELKSYIANHQG